MRDAPHDATTKALQDGAQRSLEASRTPVALPFALRFWRRHKWKIIALAIFGLFDLVFFGGFFRGHF